MSNDDLDNFLATGLFYNTKLTMWPGTVLILKHNFSSETDSIFISEKNFDFNQVECSFHLQFGRNLKERGNNFYSWIIRDTRVNESKFINFETLWEQILPEDLKEKMLFHLDLLRKKYKNQDSENDQLRIQDDF